MWELHWTPSLESHCITSQEQRKKASKEGFKYLIFYVINCIKRAMISRYSDWMTEKCRFDFWQRKGIFHVSRLKRLALGSSQLYLQHVHPFPCNAEVESKWSSTATPSFLNGMSLIFVCRQSYLLTSNTENQRSLTKIILVILVFL
jgi:hypothetical protein